jgi:hypothetical protein
MNWQNSISNQKSNNETTRLVHDVMLHPDFRLGDLVNFNATTETRKADAAEERGSSFLRAFRHASVDIDVPSGSAQESSQTFSVSGLYYRQITSLIKEAFESPISKKFHFSPFKLFRKHPDREVSDRIYSEIYNSDVLLDEHDKVQRGHAPVSDPLCKRERVVMALMFWSDATHLATFGTAKMWLIYMLFGNLSKYIRCQPNSGATKHLAYIPQLPDSLQDQLKSFHRKWDTQQSDVLTHCRRELMHAVWNFLLDDDFINAHTNGIVVKSLDGIERRVYPRVLTYSADYPEKYDCAPKSLGSSLIAPFTRVLLATIRDKGLCPCPRCLIPQNKLDRVGQVADMKIRINQERQLQDTTELVKKARKAIYEQGAPIAGAYVQRLLKPTSSIPTLVSSEMSSLCVLLPR